MTLEEIKTVVDRLRDDAAHDIEDWRTIVLAFDTLLRMVEPPLQDRRREAALSGHHADFAGYRLNGYPLNDGLGLDTPEG